MSDEIIRFPSKHERERRRLSTTPPEKHFPLAYTMRIPELSAPPIDFEAHRHEKERRLKYALLNGLISSINAEKHSLHDAEDKLLDMLDLPVEGQDKTEPVIGWLIPLNSTELSYLLYVTDTERIARVPFGSDKAEYIDTETTPDEELSIIKEALQTEHQILGHIIQNQKK